MKKWFVDFLDNFGDILKWFSFITIWLLFFKLFEFISRL
jgi:hypothetical protein